MGYFLTGYLSLLQLTHYHFPTWIITSSFPSPEGPDRTQAVGETGSEKPGHHCWKTTWHILLFGFPPVWKIRWVDWHVCLYPTVVAQPGVRFQLVGGREGWPRVWKKSEAGALGLGRALTSKVYHTESFCLRGKLLHFLPITWISLASQGSDRWERHARLLSKTVGRSKQMFFPACRGVTSCHVDCNLFGETLLPVSPLTFWLLLEKGAACLELFPEPKSFSRLSDKKKQITDSERALTLFSGRTCCAMSPAPTPSHAGWSAVACPCAPMQDVSSLLPDHIAWFLCLLLFRMRLLHIWVMALNPHHRGLSPPVETQPHQVLLSCTSCGARLTTGRLPGRRLGRGWGVNH